MSWIGERLVIGSLEGAAAIAVVWLICRRYSGVPASVQAALWWLASLKLLLALAPIPAIALPVLPGPPVTSRYALVQDPLLPPAPASATSWATILVALWSAGVLTHAIGLSFAIRRHRAIVRRSAPIAGRDRDTVDTVTRIVGLRRCPEVRTSREIAAPLVAGLFRPVVLVPAALAREDWTMALCHELMHVRRRDLALGWVPALAERLFFFHPLARVAAREYVTAREAACDAAAVRALGVAAGDYARLLVRLGAARPHPAFAAGGAPTSMSSLRRRLDMLQHAAFDAHARRLLWVIAPVLVLSLVPFELSARTSTPADTPPVPQTVRAPDRGLTTGALPGAVADGVPGRVPDGAAGGVVADGAGAVAQAPGGGAPSSSRPVQADPAARQRGEDGITPELRAILEQMRTMEMRLQQERQAGVSANEETVRIFNLLAERANRIASADEAARAAQRAAQGLDWIDEELRGLRQQQDVLTQQLQRLVDQQRRLTDTHLRLLEELNRMRREAQQP